MSISYELNAGEVWYIVSSILVMIMTPALGFFYGGLVNTKNMISMIGQCFAIYAAITMVWVILGFTLVWGDSQYGLIGDFKFILSRSVNAEHLSSEDTIPKIIFSLYHSKFACIAPALIIGSVAERVRTVPMIIYSILWSILVYCPVAHWNWNPNGWLFQLGTKDWAGGNPIHISAGMSALAMVFLIENPILLKYKEEFIQNLQHRLNDIAIQEQQTAVNQTNTMENRGDNTNRRWEHRLKMLEIKFSTSLVIIGTVLLWFGWNCFNGGGSTYTQVVGTAILNTNVAPSICLCTWILLDVTFKNKINVKGMCMSIVCGLVGITPGAGFVRPSYTAMIIGICCAVGPWLFMEFRDKYLIFDDRLDVFGCHAISAIIGGLFVALFYCQVMPDEPLKCVNPNGVGLQLVFQLVGILSAVGYSFIVSFLIFLSLQKLFSINNFKINEDEDEGLDEVDFDEAKEIFRIS